METQLDRSLQFGDEVELKVEDDNEWQWMRLLAWTSENKLIN